jgi:hypothetical protein
MRGFEEREVAADMYLVAEEHVAERGVALGAREAEIGDPAGERARLRFAVPRGHVAVVEKGSK